MNILDKIRKISYNEVTESMFVRRGSAKQKVNLFLTLYFENGFAKISR